MTFIMSDIYVRMSLKSSYHLVVILTNVLAVFQSNKAPSIWNQQLQLDGVALLMTDTPPP